MNAHPTSHPSDQTLHAYTLRQLDLASVMSVNQHLTGCPECQHRLTSLSATASPGRPRDTKVAPASMQSAVSFTDGLSMLGAAPDAQAPPAASTLPPGLADHPDYQVLRELGQGGMGVVYLAQNTLMGRLEVLKVVSSHLLNRRGVLDRFQGEIRNAARLHHPNIVAAYSAFRSGESYVLALEYVEGLDLARIVKQKGPLPVSHSCYYIHQAALGLQHAHEHGMVHRDIKPGNLMLARQGNRAIVKVLDFGLAKVQSEGAVDSGLTHEGQMLGTPDYIAPEQISNARRADIRADIYSLGCTLYYLLTGKPPFQGASLYDLLQAHHSMEATPLNLLRPDVPVQVAAIVAKMMAKEPEQRFREPKEVAQALKPCFLSENTASTRSKSTDAASRVNLPPAVPAAAFPQLADASPAAATLIEPRAEIGRGPRLGGFPTWAIATLAAALLAVLTTAVWTWVGKGRDQSGADRAALAAKTRPIPKPAPAREPKDRTAGDDPEDLVRDAQASVGRGNLHRARSLVDQYLSDGRPRKQVETARTLRSEIDLATSSKEAADLAQRLSDQDIQGYLAAQGQPLVDRDVQSPEVRRVYAQTLLRAFQREMERRQSAAKVAVAPAPVPRQEISVALAPAPKAPSNRDADADRPPAANSFGSNEKTAPAPAKGPVRNGPTTIEMILDSPRSYENRTIPLEGLYKVGTGLTRMNGADGNPIGWTVSVKGGDDRLISKADGKVAGRDRYLVVDNVLGPVLSRAFDDFKFQHTIDAKHKCTLTVTVRPTEANNTRIPSVRIVGLEILGICNFAQVAQRQYEKAFQTVRVTPERAWAEYGDGAAWVERLGGQEKFVVPLRHKLRDLQRKAKADREGAIVGNMLEATLARSVNMAIANQQQQDRFAAAFFNRR